MTDSTASASRFRFKSKGLEVEFEGPEEFISAQIEHMKPTLLRELEAITPAAIAALAFC